MQQPQINEAARTLAQQRTGEEESADGGGADKSTQVSSVAPTDFGPRATAASLRQLTAQHFHTDGLHSIFSFLILADLPSVSAVCHHWRDAVDKESSRQVSL